MKIFRRVELRPLDRRLHSLHTLPPTIRQILSTPSSAQSPVTVKGWVKYLRKQKQVAFAEINDGSCAKGLQAVLNPEDVQKYVLDSMCRTEPG
jgi:aspartyl/asparaginyl-tRNA synthetase